ncbi:diguanylate cyclase [Actinoplanes sp. SE50]|uniref:putative bifunctional diguanylate cyclase/phosphodiesterase n=1 Tax=unclassified Actinoplanes TaxID=2626549 RepID=UPI00023EDF14|nr:MULTISPECIES: EAL domain-containing protein [unclassified Actinoplanes]AEV88261.1 putative signaling protein [Actinoplanes sp. SE50/110]ATO86666.1 diguanylate cyclase [Actinoplanes sp. SE50]SLM04084.1 GGDEF domain-containing protein [Actinoplanes sp. SE50/110]
MAVSPLAPARPSNTGRAALLAVCSAAALVLLTGVFGLLPGPLTLAVGVGVAGLCASAYLVHAALDIHHADGTFVACRGAGFVGMGALATALTALIPWWSPPHAVLWLTAGLGVAAGCYVLGAALLPNAARTWPIRLRRGFDGLGLGVSLGYAAYLIPPDGQTRPAALPALLITAGGVSIVTVVVLRARPRPVPTVWCGCGAAVVLAALAALAEVLALGLTGPAVPLLGLAMVAGLAAAAGGGSRRGLPVPPAEPRSPDQYLASYPLLAVPAVVGVAAALWHLVTTRHFDAGGIVFGMVMVSVLVLRELLVVRDIRRYAGRLRIAEAHFRSLVAGATDLTLVLDDRLTVRWQSPAAARLFGLHDNEVVGRAFGDLIHPEDAGDALAVIGSVLAGEHEGGPPVLVSARLRDGSQLWRDTESTISDQRAVPEVAALVVHVRDVGERRHLERTLHRMAYLDQLTGLANRRALMRDLLAARRRPGGPGTLLVIDLHGLAEVNDTHGRAVGDAVLTEVARRLRALSGGEDVPARLAGDEFAVLTPESAVPAYALATRLVSALAEPCQLPGAQVRLHTSVGLAELAGAAGPEEVLRQADLARQRAAQLGRDAVEWYDPDVELHLQRRMELERQLPGAAARGELDLVFQPVSDLRDGHPAGVEALLRWRHPALGTIRPEEFLPIAAGLGITDTLNEWALNDACRHLRNWTGGDDDFWVSVNVGPRELLTARFPEQVRTTLRRHAVTPERLVVEVAQTWIAEDVPAVVAALAGLRRLGVRAALDDFGSSQTSLTHLRRLPVDMVKLSAELAGAEAGKPVLDVVVGLAKRIGLDLVAKGLETPEQIERVLAAGCRYGQGTALVPPAPAERIEAYLETHRADRGS